MSYRRRMPGARRGRTLKGVYRAVRTWMQEHPRLVDAVPAVPLFLLSTVGVSSMPHDAVWWVALLVAGGQCGPVVIRRERPMTAFVIASLAAFAQWLLNMGLLPANLLLFAALYNVASRRRWQDAAFAAAALELGAVLAHVRWIAPAWWGETAIQLIQVTILIGSMWVWGNSVRTRRAYLASLEERAVRLERERDNQAQIAAAAERARIAREMHDVVSHNLGVMVVQADGAAYAMDSDPGRARQALSTISATGRTALTEMRRMLGVLRDEDAGEAEREYGPQPGIAQLDQMVEQTRGSGLDVEFTVEGVPRELPAGLDLAAYRVVQEALTNTLKHAGPGVSGARVRLRYGSDALEMRISDDGRGAGAVLSDGTPDGVGQPGHGLIGMRERVAAYGGSVRTGPKTGGGFEVVALLPLQTASV